MIFLFHVSTDGLGKSKIQRKIAKICRVLIPDTHETGRIRLVNSWCIPDTLETERIRLVSLQ